MTNKSSMLSWEILGDFAMLSALYWSHIKSICLTIVKQQ